MEAIRQYIKVTGRNISITLPDDFNADEVEVIILPSAKYPESIPEWQIQEVRERSADYHKNPSIGIDFDQAIKDIEDGL